MACMDDHGVQADPERLSYDELADLIGDGNKVHCVIFLLGSPVVPATLMKRG
jgi:hypothetical protein